MSFTSDFANLLIHTIAYEAWTGYDEYGAPSYAAPVNLVGRVTYRNRKVTSRLTGEEILTTAELWIAPLESITADDRFTLPSGEQPVIADWQTIPNDKGNYHTKVFFGARGG